MATVKPYPHYEINVEDRSIYEPVEFENLPIHRPVYMLRAQQGPVGEPVWCNQISEARRTFGELTFDDSDTTYFDMEGVFLNESFQNNGAFLIRLADKAALQALVILDLNIRSLSEEEAEGTKQKYALRWQSRKTIKFANLDMLAAKRPNGSDGQPVSEENALADSLQYYIAHVENASMIDDIYDPNYSEAGTHVLPPTVQNYMVVPGAALYIWNKTITKWEMLTTEVLQNLGKDQTINWNSGAEDEVAVPMMAYVAENPGEWGNDLGISLYSEEYDNDLNLVERAGACYYRFAPWRRDKKEATVNSIKDISNGTYQTFVMKENAIDSSSKLAVSMESVFDAAYIRNRPLPMKIFLLRHNWNKICEVLYAAEFAEAIEKNVLYDPVSNPLGTVTADYNWINPLTGFGWKPVFSGEEDVETVKMEYGKYDTFTVNDSSELAKLLEDNGVSFDVRPTSYTPDANAILYLKGGTDGDLSDVAHESNIRQFLNMDTTINPDIEDSARYPFTHFFDVGYAVDTKHALISFLGVRQDIKVMIATQTVTEAGGTVRINTYAQDRALAEALRMQALLQRESVSKGTGCFRATIVMQTGYALSGLYKGPIPLTFWHASKKAEYQNTDHLAREPKGLPWAAMGLLKNLNWVPASEDMKSLSWDVAGNYVQYYDMKSLHYASIRSVYKYETSVLVDDIFTDAIVYTKHEIRQSWATFVGRSDPFELLKLLIEQDITKRLTRLYNSKYTFTVLCYQTEEDLKLGYSLHVQIEITAPATKRVWVVDVVCKREGYEQNAA